MRLFYDYFIEIGIDRNLVDVAIKAFYEALAMMLVVSIHKFYIFNNKKRKIPIEEQSHETISRLIDECCDEKEFYILFVIFYLIFIVANYVFIIR
jgi:hypothetical protein